MSSASKRTDPPQNYHHHSFSTIGHRPPSVGQSLMPSTANQGRTGGALGTENAGSSGDSGAISAVRYFSTLEGGPSPKGKSTLTANSFGLLDNSIEYGVAPTTAHAKEVGVSPLSKPPGGSSKTPLQLPNLWSSTCGGFTSSSAPSSASSLPISTVRSTGAPQPTSTGCFQMIAGSSNRRQLVGSSSRSSAGSGGGGNLTTIGAASSFTNSSARYRASGSYHQENSRNAPLSSSSQQSVSPQHFTSASSIAYNLMPYGSSKVTRGSSGGIANQDGSKTTPNYSTISATNPHQSIPVSSSASTHHHSSLQRYPTLDQMPTKYLTQTPSLWPPPRYSQPSSYNFNASSSERTLSTNITPPRPWITSTVSSATEQSSRHIHQPTSSFDTTKTSMTDGALGNEPQHRFLPADNGNERRTFHYGGGGGTRTLPATSTSAITTNASSQLIRPSQSNHMAPTTATTTKTTYSPQRSGSARPLSGPTASSISGPKIYIGSAEGGLIAHQLSSSSLHASIASIEGGATMQRPTYPQSSPLAVSRVSTATTGRVPDREKERMSTALSSQENQSSGGSIFAELGVQSVETGLTSTMEDGRSELISQKKQKGNQQSVGAVERGLLPELPLGEIRQLKDQNKEPSLEHMVSLTSLGPLFPASKGVPFDSQHLGSRRRDSTLLTARSDEETHSDSSAPLSTARSTCEPLVVQPAYVRNRRTAVSSESVTNERIANWNPPCYPKAAEDRAKISEVIRSKLSLLFGHLRETNETAVIDAMQEKIVPKGVTLIQQGDEGDFFYIVETGRFDIFVSRLGEEPKKVLEAGPGMSFGELALMYNAPRAATCISTEDSKVWALDRTSFQMMLVTAENTKKRRYEELLDNIEILKGLTKLEKSQLSDILCIQPCRKGDCIIRQGDRGEKFFIVESGEFVCCIAQDGEMEFEVSRYTRGGFFGELALITEYGIRKASVYAAEDGAALLWIDKTTFDRVLGPIVNILRKNADNYPTYSDLIKQFNSRRSAN